MRLKYLKNYLDVLITKDLKGILYAIEKLEQGLSEGVVS